MRLEHSSAQAWNSRIYRICPPLSRLLCPCPGSLELKEKLFWANSGLAVTGKVVISLFSPEIGNSAPKFLPAAVHHSQIVADGCNKWDFPSLFPSRDYFPDDLRLQEQPQDLGMGMGIGSLAALSASFCFYFAFILHFHGLRQLQHFPWKCKSTGMCRSEALGDKTSPLKNRFSGVFLAPKATGMHKKEGIWGREK